MTDRTRGQYGIVVLVVAGLVLAFMAARGCI